MLLSLKENGESLNVEWIQGANFSRVKCGEKASQVLLENKIFSAGYLGDNGSENSPISCFCVSGKARWCLSLIHIS